MRSISRTALLAIVASLTLTVAAASASAALPEFKPVPSKKKFTSAGGTLTFKQGSSEYTCAASTATGEVTGARTVGKVAMVLTGCVARRTSGGSCPLSSVGAKSGEIVIRSLDGELGTIKTTEAPSGAGLLLRPETEKKWTTLAGNECTSETSVTGVIAAEISTVGKKQTTNKLVVRQGVSGGIREITLDSGKLVESEFVMWSRETSVQTSDELVFEEAVEVT